MPEVFRGVLWGRLVCGTLSSTVEEVGQAAEVVQPCYKGFSGLTTQVGSSLLTCAVSRLTPATGHKRVWHRVPTSAEEIPSLVNVNQ